VPSERCSVEEQGLSETVQGLFDFSHSDRKGTDARADMCISRTVYYAWSVLSPDLYWDRSHFRQDGLVS
jgi:hypothetical protein